MKIVRLFKLVSLLGIMLSLQGCPITHYSTGSIVYTFAANILANQDTLEVLFPTHNGEYHADTLSPSNYLVSVSWEREFNSTENGNAQSSKLRVRKFSNHAESIVIKTGGVFINDVFYPLNDIYSDPADSIRILVFGNGNTQTIIRHMQEAPCPLEYVIEQLSKDYPDLIHRINDTEWHDIDYSVIYESEYVTPRIYLPK